MSGRVRSVSPQQPDDVVIDVPAASRASVVAAIEAARCAQGEWWAAAPTSRSAALADVANAVATGADELSTLIVREVGKPLVEARGEVARAIAIFQYAAQQALDPTGEVLPREEALLYTQRRPRGVAGLITPWNFPAAIPVWKAAPALAVGNTVIVKPAPQATATALRLGEIVSGVLPPAVFAIVPGGSGTGADVVDLADVVSFTGSAAIGRGVATAAVGRGVPFQAEMGGCNVSIVLPDADREHAARTIAAAAMSFAGQKCTATSRVIVAGDDDGFTDALVAAVDRLAVGDPADHDVTVGPVIGPDAVARTVAAGRAASAGGIAQLTGNRALPEVGSFVAPVILDDPDGESLVANEEVFGPICTLERTANVPSAIRAANRGTFGLVAALFTADLADALTATQQLEAGLVRINEATTGVEFHAPFGGEKASSQGPREQGKYGRDLYTSVHTITLRTQTARGI